jgi:plastocyanin
MIHARSTWPARMLLTVLALVLATIPNLALTGPVAAQGNDDAQVKVVDFAFEPATLEVPVGTTVTWTNTGSRPHTVTADDGSFDSGRLDPGEQFSQRFDQPGTFAYHCGFHPEMQATIVVTAQAQAQDQGGIEVATAAAEEPTAAAQASTPTTQTASTESTAGPSRDLTPVDPSRLAHIHAGTCDELGIVVYSLSNIRTYRIEEGDSGVGAVEVITGTAKVPLDGLFGEPFSIHVHESAQNKQRYLVCADVGGQPAAPWTDADGLVLEAKEQNNSGYSGFATLQPSADGGTNVTITMAASPSAVQAAAAEPAPPPSTTYKSPTFGYTIGYGPTWQESENASTNGTDRFVLFNGKSYITFTGEAAYGGDPKACVDGFVKELTADPNVSNLQLATDENGQPAQGETAATGAYAIYDHDYRFSDRTEPYTLFVGCIPLVPNQAVLAVVQNVPTADYDEEVNLREALLRGLTLPQ